VLSWFSFAAADKPIGITTPFEQAAALLARPFAQAFLAEPGKQPKIGFEWMLVIGVFVGAWLSSRLSGDRGTADVPALWRERFGASRGRRWLWAFLGGAVMMLGARIAGGCTSGHGISGGLQLAVSSWVFLVTFFAAGVATAMLLYGRKADSHV
jgi:hypothetical protein